jgi:hypothetical protein
MLEIHHELSNKEEDKQRIVFEIYSCHLLRSLFVNYLIFLPLIQVDVLIDYSLSLNFDFFNTKKKSIHKERRN